MYLYKEKYIKCRQTEHARIENEKICLLRFVTDTVYTVLTK